MKFRKLITVSALLGLCACAHQAVEKDLDAKVAAEPTVSSAKALSTEAKADIAAMSGLTNEQRMDLRSLKDSTDAQVESLREQSYKLRAVLVKDLLSPQYDDSEVELIKSKLKSIEDKRLTAVFSAVEKANAILGRTSAQKRENTQFMDSLFEGRGQGTKAD